MVPGQVSLDQRRSHRGPAARDCSREVQVAEKRTIAIQVRDVPRPQLRGYHAAVYPIPQTELALRPVDRGERHPSRLPNVPQPVEGGGIRPARRQVSNTYDGIFASREQVLHALVECVMGVLGSSAWGAPIGIEVL